MKLGTQIRLPDGREGTVIYNSLIGVGIKWGLYDPDPKDFEGTDGNTFVERSDPLSEDWWWEPNAILRDPWPGAEEYGFAQDECVGEKYEIIRDGL